MGHGSDKVLAKAPDWHSVARRAGAPSASEVHTVRRSRWKTGNAGEQAEGAGAHTGN